MRVERGARRPHGGAGFTLIELAVVLVIMGILAPLVYNAVTSYVMHEKEDLAKVAMERAQELVFGELLAGGGILPSPDSGDLAPLTLAVSKDPWQSRLGYWRAPELAGSSLGAVRATTMEVRIYTDVGSGGAFPAADATLDRIIPDVAYVLVSSGPNLARETVVDTSSGIVVSVLRGGGPLRDGAGTEFDDIVEYVSLRQLQGRYMRVQ